MKKLKKFYKTVKYMLSAIAHPDKNYQNAGYRKYRT